MHGGRGCWSGSWGGWERWWGDHPYQPTIDHDLGVTTQRTYAVKRIDSDFFGEE